jgi:hypothetical protein
VAGSEAAGIDLYNGFAELLGRERAETLMAALPSYDTSDLATKSDIAVLGARIDGLEARVAGVESIVSGLGLRMDPCSSLWSLVCS